jgi:RNase adaptor protein for sRNA GlmZ degradation
MARYSVTRRRFTLGAAAAATAALISPTEALEQAQSAGSSQQASSLEQKAKAAMAKLSPSAQAEVEMKVASIFRKYGDRLNDDQRADIRRAMAETQDGLEKMRAFVLENGDQPATVLKLRREGGKR